MTWILLFIYPASKIGPFNHWTKKSTCSSTSKVAQFHRKTADLATLDRGYNNCNLFKTGCVYVHMCVCASGVSQRDMVHPWHASQVRGVSLLVVLCLVRP